MNSSFCNFDLYYREMVNLKIATSCPVWANWLKNVSLSFVHFFCTGYRTWNRSTSILAFKISFGIFWCYLKIKHSSSYMGTYFAYSSHTSTMSIDDGAISWNSNPNVIRCFCKLTLVMPNTCNNQKVFIETLNLDIKN